MHFRFAEITLNNTKSSLHAGEFRNSMRNYILPFPWGYRIQSEKIKRSRPMPRSMKWYGWVPDIPDPRDFLYAAPSAVLQQLPPKVDLTSDCPDIYDQGAIGSCTANAIGGAFEFEQRKMSLQEWIPSRLFIYYNERAMEDTTDQDSGARIRDGIKSVVNWVPLGRQIGPTALISL
jgi:hypothetical protein